MSDYKNLSDSDLILLLREGSENAYTEIYNRYYYLMIVFAYKKLRDEELAKDLIQELFANLWEDKEVMSKVNNMAAYLIIAVRNRMFDYFAHQNVKSKYIQSIAEYSNNLNNTDYLIRENQLKEYIEKAISELPSKMREVFELSRKSDLSYKEIAEKLSISERTVNNQITNALNRLRTKLGFFVTLVILSFSK